MSHNKPPMPIHLRDRRMFINGHKDLVHETLKVIPEDPVHDKSL